SFLVTTWNYIDIGLWGIFTLGTIPKEHHSIQLLLQGLIALIVLAFGIAIYIFNIWDARSDAKLREAGYKKPTLFHGVADVYDKGFPLYMVLPWLIMLIFIVVLPLLVMVALAFTDYNQYNAPARTLLNWVGFEFLNSLFTIDRLKDSFFNVLTLTI